MKYKGNERLFDAIGVIVVILLLLVSVWYYVNESHKCEDRGGKYLRGAWNYECVQVLEK